MLRSTLIIIILVFSASLSAGIMPLTEDELEYELLDINVGGSFVLLESAEVYRYGDNFLVPFEVLVQLLELNLSIDPNLRVIEGVVNNETVEFNLTNDSENIFYVSSIDSISYVSTNLIEEILGVDIQIEFTRLLLTIESNYLFPIQIRLDRESRDVVKLRQKGTQNFEGLIPDQYRLYTPPKGYASLQYAANNNSNSYISSAQLYGDLLYHQASFNLNKSSNSDLRLGGVLAKSQLTPDEKLYGLFNNYALGDVASVNNLVDISYSGLGAVFSSFDNRYDNYYGKVSIRETGPAGWQVELYKNGYLIQIGQVAENGDIIFDDIDVDYGLNRFQIKLYGEYGEVETKDKEIIVGQNSLKPGELAFNGGVIDSSKSLFNKNNLFSESTTLAGFLQTKIGVSMSTSIGLSYFYEQAPEDQFKVNEFQTDKHEVVFSINQILDNAFLDASAFYKNDEQYKLKSTFLGSLGRFTRYNFNITADRNYDLETPEIQQNYDSLNYQANLSTRFNSMLLGLTNRRTEVDYGEFQFKSDYLSLNTSFRIKKFTFTNVMTYSSSQSGLATNPRNTNVVNNFALTTTINNIVSLRLSTDFDLFKDNETKPEFKAINASANWRVSERVSLSNLVSYDRNKNYQVQANASWRHQKFNLTAGAQILNDNRWSIGLGINFGLDYNYHSNEFIFSGQHGQRSAALDIFNYIDNNKNNRYDEFDEPLPNVKFGNNKAWEQIRSDEQGFAYITGISSGRPTKVYFDTNDTKAENLKSNYKQATYYSHAGGIVTHKIPFNYYVELDGVVEDDSDFSTAKLVPIELFDFNGKLIKRVITDLDDNYYYFGAIEAGKYTIKVSDSYLKDKNLVSIPSETKLHFNGRDGFKEVPAIKLVSKEQATKETSEFRNIQLDTREFFTVQFGAYNDKEYCALRVEQLKASGLTNAFYSMASNSCKVLAGEFKSETQAEVFRKTLPPALLLDGFTTIYRLGDDLFSIQIAAFSIQLSAMTNVNGCGTSTFGDIDYLKGEFYVLETGNYCKLYVGDFISKDNAVDKLNQLPEKIRKGAFIVKR